MATHVMEQAFFNTRSSADSAGGAITGSATAASDQYRDHMDWDDGTAWFMFGMMAVFWLGVIVLGVWAIASYNRRHASSVQSPLDVARHRYARGEISAEESSG